MTVQFTATVWPGSDKQVNAGILASATVHVFMDNEHIIDLCDWKVRNTSNGLAALPPSRDGGVDAKTNKRRYFNIFRLNSDAHYREAQAVIMAKYQETAASQQPANTPVPGPVQSFPSAGGPSNAPPPPQTPQVQTASVPTPEVPSGPPTPQPVVAPTNSTPVQPPADKDNWSYGD